MISVTFPDGASRRFEAGLSGADIAKSISPSLLTTRASIWMLDHIIAVVGEGATRRHPRTVAREVGSRRRATCPT